MSPSQLADLIAADPARAPLPAGAAELDDVYPALREVAWDLRDPAAADTYADRVRGMYAEGAFSRVARMLADARTFHVTRRIAA